MDKWDEIHLDRKQNEHTNSAWRALSHIRHRGIVPHYVEKHMRQIRVTPHQGRLQIVFEMEDDSQMAVALEPEQAEALGLTLVNCVQFPDDLNRSLFAETPQVSVSSPRFEVTGSLETSQIVCAFRAATMRPWQLQFSPHQAEALREQLDSALKLVRADTANPDVGSDTSVVQLRKKTD